MEIDAFTKDGHIWGPEDKLPKDAVIIENPTADQLLFGRVVKGKVVIDADRKQEYNALKLETSKAAKIEKIIREKLHTLCADEIEAVKACKTCAEVEQL